MLDEVLMALHVTESEEVSLMVRGTFPSPITVRGVNGIDITAGQNNIHSSISGVSSHLVMRFSLLLLKGWPLT